MEPVHARSKAAAWAWYQRGSGSPAALAPAQSEAAGRGTLSTRLVRGGSPSRFKLEAEFLLSNAPIDDVSDRLKSLHLSPSSSNSSSCSGSDIVANMNGTGMLVASPLNLIASDALDNSEDLAIAMSSFNYGTAAWDCGSALFDSFELVAMSKKLDDAHQLIQGTLDKVCPHEVDVSSTGVCGRIDTIIEGANKEAEEEGKEETNTGFLSDDDGQLLMSINDSCGLADANTDVNGALYGCKQSRQAIYDMFCRYDNLTPPGESVCDDEHIKKQSTPAAMSPASARSSKQYRRRRLHSLSKAFRHHFMQLTSQSRMRPWSSTPDESRLPQSSSLPAKASSNSHAVHHHKRTCAVLAESPGRVDLIKAEGGGLQASSPTLRKQYKSSDDGHHLHHHHYHHHHHHHFLFQRHSDDAGFGVLPVVTPQLMGTDKSHLVAAAGLRASKVSSLQDYLSLSSKLEGGVLDPKRRWGDEDHNSVASANMEARAFPIHRSD